MAFSRRVAGDFSLDSANSRPVGIWGNATRLWVMDADTSITGGALGCHAYAYTHAGVRASADDKFFPGIVSPQGLWSDGRTFFVTDAVHDSIRAHAFSTGARVTSSDVRLSSLNSLPRDIWADSSRFYIGDLGDDRVYAYTRSSGSLDLGRSPRIESTVTLSSVWSDGTTLWVGLDRSDPDMLGYVLSTGARDSSKDFHTGASRVSTRGVWARGVDLWVLDGAVVRAFRDTPPPAAPTSVVASGAPGEMTVSWAAPPSGIDAVRVTYTGPASSTTVLGAVSSTVIRGLSQGTYTVTVAFRNAGGWSPESRQVTAVVQRVLPPPPGTPAAPTLASRTTTSLSLTTSAGSGSAPSRYRWRISDNVLISDSDTIRTSAGPSITITGLSPGTDYWVDVRGEGEGGNSAYSGDLAASTLPLAPSAPSAPTVDVLSGSTARVTVTGLPSGLTSLRIAYTTGGVERSVDVTPAAASWSETITGLIPGPLSVRVSVSNEGGMSPFSPATTATVIAPPQAPRAPEVRVLGPTSAEASIAVSLGITAVRAEAVDGAGATSSRASLAVTPGSVTALIFSPLQGGRVRIRAAQRNSVGWSDWSPYTPAILIPVAPSRPQQLFATASDGGAALSWLPPVSDGGAPVEYEERHRELDGDYGDWSDPEPSTARAIGGLENGVIYRFEVRAVNTGGPSDAAESNEVQPQLGLPPAAVPASDSELVVWPSETTRYEVGAGDAAIVKTVAQRPLGRAIDRVLVELGRITQFGDFVVEAQPDYIARTLRWGIRAHSDSAMSVTLRTATIADAQRLALEHAAARVIRIAGDERTVDFTGPINHSGTWVREEADNRTWLVDIAATSAHRTASDSLMIKSGVLEAGPNLDSQLDWSVFTDLPDALSQPQGLAVSPDGTLFHVDGGSDLLYTRSGGSWDTGVALPSGENLPTGLVFVEYSGVLWLAGNAAAKCYPRTSGGWGAGVDGPGELMIGLAQQPDGNLATTGPSGVHLRQNDGSWVTVRGPGGGVSFRDLVFLPDGTMAGLSHDVLWVRDPITQQWSRGPSAPDNEAGPRSLDIRDGRTLFLSGSGQRQVYSAAVPIRAEADLTEHIPGSIQRTFYHRVATLPEHARLRARELGPRVLVDDGDWPETDLEVRSAVSRPLSYLDAVRTAAERLGDGWQVDSRARFKPLLHRDFTAHIAAPLDRDWNFQMRGASAADPRGRDFTLVEPERELPPLSELKFDDDDNAVYEEGRVVKVAQFGVEFDGLPAVATRIIALDPGGAGARYPLPALVDPAILRVGVIRFGSNIPVGDSGLNARVGEVDEELPGRWNLTDTHLERTGPINDDDVPTEESAGAAQRWEASGWRFVVVADIVDRAAAVHEVTIDSFEPVEIGRIVEVEGAGSPAVSLVVTGQDGRIFIDRGTQDEEGGAVEGGGQVRVHWTIRCAQSHSLSESIDGLQFYREQKVQQRQE